MNVRLHTSGSLNLTSRDDDYIRYPVMGAPYLIHVKTWYDSLDYRVSEGRDTPNYHARKRKGELLPLTYWRQFKVKGSASGISTLEYYEADQVTLKNTDIILNWNPFDAYWAISESELQEWISDAEYSYYVQAAAAKIASSGWDALTFVAELSKTIHMFRTFVKNIIARSTDLRVDKSWLEARYGWRTLWYDIEDINKALKNLNGERKRFKESIGSNTSTTVERIEPIVWGSGTRNLRIVDTVEVGVRGTVVADIDPPDFSFNPVITSWELFTFSFVIDWVVNVGQFLEALSFIALSSNHVAAGGLNVKLNRFVHIQDIEWAPRYGGSQAAEATCNAELTIRHPTTVPLRPLSKLRLDAFKIMDLVALFLSIVIRR